MTGFFYVPLHRQIEKFLFVKKSITRATYLVAKRYKRFYPSAQKLQINILKVFYNTDQTEP